MQTKLEQAFEIVKVEDNTLRGVKILGFVSESHRRKYPLEAMRLSAPLYEGAQVNIDHPSIPGQPRPASSPFGRIRNPRVEEARGLVADLVFNPGHPLAAAIKWAAENDPSQYMLSHLADLIGRKENGWFITRQVEKVYSVDVVSNGGTTTGLFESAVEGEPPMELISMTREAIQAARQDLKVLTAAEANADTLRHTELTTKITALEAANTELKAKVDGFVAAEALRTKSEDRLKKIGEAKLPEQLVTDTFRALCMEASDERFAALLKERQDLAAATKFPTSRARDVSESMGSPAPTKTSKEFAAILKGGR